MRKKRIKSRLLNLLQKYDVPVKPNVNKEVKYIEKKGYFPISETDRITYVLKLDQNYKKAIITCVSLDILFNDEWITIDRFDTEHGYLHQHVLTKIGEEPKVVIPTIKKNASLDYIFDWTVNHFYNNFYFYRRHFIKNNKDKLKSSIDNY
jgi:hypothetical protein